MAVSVHTQKHGREVSFNTDKPLFQLLQKKGGVGWGGEPLKESENEGRSEGRRKEGKPRGLVQFSPIFPPDRKSLTAIIKTGRDSFGSPRQLLESL